MAQFQFNAREVEPDAGRVGAIPAGWYKTMVTKTELKPTNDGTGTILAATFQVLEGSYKGAPFFNNFNVQNNSEKAMEIGRKQLSALCHAVGLMEMQDTDQLKSIPFYTRLKLTPAELNEDKTVKYEEKNEPSAFKHIQDQMAIAACAKQQTAPAAGPTTGGNIPPAAQVIPAQQPQTAYQAPPPAQHQWNQNAQQQQAPQQFTPPPMQQQPQQQPQFQQQPQQAPAPQFQPQAQQAPQQFQPQQAPSQPDWAAAPAQPWGQPAAGAPQQGQQQQQAPVMSPEQQQQHTTAMQAPPPWVPAQ